MSPHVCPEHFCGDKDLSILTLAARLMIFCVNFYEYMCVVFFFLIMDITGTSTE